jgi:hypothetical protein
MVVDPITGVTPSETPSAIVSAIFSGETPCFSNSTNG